MLSLLNAQKLGLSPSSPTDGTTIVAVSDGFVVAGSDYDGFYAPDGTTADGRPVYQLVTNHFIIFTHGLGIWRQDTRDSDGLAQQADGVAYDFPWQVPEWISIGATNPPSTLTHPAIQRLVAPGGGALLVSGDTSGTYTKRTDFGATVNGRVYYSLLGQSTLDSEYITWSGVRWEVAIGGEASYYSLSDTPTPLTATNWKNASDDSPASITIAPTDPQGGVAVIGGTQDGAWTKDITQAVNGKASYTILGQNEGGDFGFYWETDLSGVGLTPSAPGFVLRSDEGPQYYSLSAVATPDLAGTDKVTLQISNPDLGVSVWKANGTNNGKKSYSKLSPGEDYSIFWSTDLQADVGGPSSPGWAYVDNDGPSIVWSTSNVATPDLATGWTNDGGAFALVVTNVAWLNAADDTPASISVTSISVGELNAGVTMAGNADAGVYVLAAPAGGQTTYSILGGVLGIINAGVGEWDTNSAFALSVPPVAFPWQADWSGNSPAPTVTRNDVASEANWQLYTPASNADLASLTPSAGTLDPTFDPSITDYTLIAANGTTATAVTDDVNASVTSPVTLSQGTNTIIVTAEDGATTKSYVIILTLPASAPEEDNGLTEPAFSERNGFKARYGFLARYGFKVSKGF